MAYESNLTLNPRVSVFRHNGGIYLFDPSTRTYASMNDTMLSFITKLADPDSFDYLSSDDRKELTGVAEQLQRVGILISPQSDVKSDRYDIPYYSDSITHLAIFVTTKCNLRCTYCYACGGDYEKTISRNIWRPAMDQFFSNLKIANDQGWSNRTSVNLAIHGGGEPTVEFESLKDIVEDFCEHARTAALLPTVGMGTNGTYDDTVRRWIIENNINVNISLDGPRAIHNNLRPFRSGEPSYDVVMRNLQALINLGKHTSIRVTVTNNTLKSMEETVELANEIGLSVVHFEPVSLTGRCATSALARPNAEQFAENFLKCFLLGLKYDIDVHYSGMRCFDHRHQRFCAACGHNFCVTPDGYITTCYEVLDFIDPAASKFFIGRVDPVRGRVVLDQARIERLKQRVADNMDACNGCFLRYHCAGDCPVKSFRYSGHNLYSPDPYRCQIADRINKQLIVWLADGIIEPRDVEPTSIISLNRG